MNSENFHYTYLFIEVLIAKDKEIFLSKNVNVYLYDHIYPEGRFTFRTNPVMHLIFTHQFDLARRLLYISTEGVSNIGLFKVKVQMVMIALRLHVKTKQSKQEQLTYSSIFFKSITQIHMWCSIVGFSPNVVIVMIIVIMMKK